jgi:hypothetical protein
VTAAEAGDTPILQRLLQEREEDTELFPPVSGDLDDLPTVEFRAVKPPRFTKRWLRENLSWKRQLVGGASVFVFLATALGRWFT